MEDRLHSLEDDLQWKKTFDGRKPSMQDDLWREKTRLLNWRLPKLEFDTKDQVLSIYVKSLSNLQCLDFTLIR